MDLFRPLQVLDDGLRRGALQTVLDRLKKLEREQRQLLLSTVPTMVRLSVECPFPDVRAALTEFLAHLRSDLLVTWTPPMPPSAFIPEAMLVPAQPDGGALRTLFEQSFVTFGRVSHVSRVLASHPTYLETYLTTMSTVLHGDGPLPLPWRAFIGVMAAARHRCVYLVRRMQDTFLSVGGDREWLRLGLAAGSPVPPKLAALAELNALLAHRPWLVNEGHVKGLVRGSAACATCTPTAAAGAPAPGAAAPPPWSWSLNEVVHAIVILATFHALTSLVLGCGVCREADNGSLVGASPCLVTVLTAQQAAAATAAAAAAAAAAEAAAVEARLAEAAAASAAAPAPAAAAALPAPAAHVTVGYSDLGDVSALEARLRARLLHRCGGGGGAATLADGDDGLEIGALPPSLAVQPPGSPAHSFSRSSMRSGSAVASLHRRRLGDGSAPQSPSGSTPRVAAAASGELRSPTLEGAAAGAEPARHNLPGALPSVADSHAGIVNPRSPLRDALREGAAAAPPTALMGSTVSDPPGVADAAHPPAAAEHGVAWRRPADDESSGGGWALRTDSFRLDDGVAARRGGALGGDDVSQHPSVSSDGLRRPGDRAGRGRRRHRLRGAVDSATLTTDHTQQSSSSGYDDEDEDVDDAGDEEEDDEDEEEEDEEEATFFRAGTSAVIELPRNLVFGPVDCGVIDGSGRTSEAAETGFAALRGSGPLSHVAVEALAEVYARNKISRERRQLKKTSSSAAAAGRTASFSEHPAVAAVAAAAGSGFSAAAAHAPLAETPAVEISPQEAEPADSQVVAAVAGSGGDGTAAASGALVAGAAADASGDVGGFDVEGLHYADFELASSGGMSLVTHDFSWEEHAYALLQRYYPAAAPVLDTQFRLTYSLTYHTFGGLVSTPASPAAGAVASTHLRSDGASAAAASAAAAAPSSEIDRVDTESFRTGIWNYVQRLYGVRNDHYDYRRVNLHVTLMTKTFIKKACCFPELLTEYDWGAFTTIFTADEKTHILLLATEAKKQAALLYGLSAVMRHVTAGPAF